MTDGSVDDIFVEIQVRLDQLDAGMRAGEARVNTGVDRMEKIAERGIFGDRFTQNAVRSIAKIGATLALIRGSIGAADIATDLWQLGMANVRGETERIARELDSIRETGNRIPFIGATAQGIAAFIGNIGGFETPAEKHLKTLLQIQEAREAVARGKESFAFARELAIQEKQLAVLGATSQEEAIRLTLIGKIFEIQQRREALIEKGVTPLRADQFVDIEERKAFDVRARASRTLRDAEEKARLKVEQDIEASTLSQTRNAKREIELLRTINEEERIRLRAVHELEDVELGIRELRTRAEAAGLGGESSAQIGLQDRALRALTQAQMNAALSGLQGPRRFDPTTSFNVAGGGTFTTGVGGGLAALPRKVDQANHKLDRLIDAVERIGFQ